ncbi:MAG: hypothetical protein LAT84_08870 [Balneolia bacterium]|nr:hypothetical protein [Balneolia bacterium]
MISYLIFLALFAFGPEQEKTLVVMTFADASESGISIEEIDARYTDALHAEAEKGLFNQQSEHFIEAYQVFLSGLAHLLNENDFFWPEQTRIFSRIYFANDGTVEYFFINEAQANLDENELQEFLRLTGDFVSEHAIAVGG